MNRDRSRVANVVILGRLSSASIGETGLAMSIIGLVAQLDLPLAPAIMPLMSANLSPTQPSQGDE